MRDIPAAISQHLDSGVTTLCHCWKLTPARGEALGFTDHDRDIVFDNVTFEAASGFTASDIEQALGFKVDNLEASGALQSERLTEARIARGDFDHAQVEIWRVNWADASQRYLMRKGHVGEITRSGRRFTAELRGVTALLDQPRGRVIMRNCDATVGDARCRVDLGGALFRGTGTVTASDGNTRLSVDGLSAFSPGWFSRGMLTWLSGSNAGVASEIKTHIVRDGSVTLDIWESAPSAIGVGDRFTVTAGCDKSFAQCRERFSNGLNFRGFPHIPGDDFVMSYPLHDDPANTGGSFQS